MKLDTSQPKDWDKFISDLEVTGIEKLILQNCIVTFWHFPTIVLTLEPHQQPFISQEREESLRVKIGEYYEYNSISLRIEVKDTYKEKHLNVNQLILILKRLETELKHLKYYSPLSDFRISEDKQESIKRCRECINNLDDRFKDFGF
jgi:hypothetical protein